MGHSDMASCQKTLDQVMASAAEIGRPSFRWVAANLDCCLRYGFGEPDQVEAKANVAFALAEEAGEPDGFDFYASQIMGVRYMQGRALEIIDQIVTAADENPEIPAYRGAAAMMLATEGEHDKASELLKEAAAEGFDFRVNGTWALTVPIGGRPPAWWATSKPQRRSTSCWHPWSGQLCCSQSISSFTIDGILAPLAALLGRPDDAEEHFAIAERLLDEGAQPLNQAINRLARARYLRRPG